MSIEKIFRGHLEFEFNHEEGTIIVRDHMYKIEYELLPIGHHGLPFTLIKRRDNFNDSK